MPKRPIGRPPRLDEVHHVDRSGTDVTIADTILISIRAGDYLETAAALAGVHKETFYAWLRLAAAARAKVRKAEKPTALERRCIEFSDAVAVAEAEAQSRDVATIARAGQLPSTKKVKVTRTGPDGQTVEEREETLPPDWRATAWRTERRWPRQYGRQSSVEVSGPDGGPIPIDVAAANLAAKLAALQGDTAGPVPEPPAEDDLDELQEG